MTQYIKFIMNKLFLKIFFKLKFYKTIEKLYRAKIYVLVCVYVYIYIYANYIA